MRWSIVGISDSTFLSVSEQQLPSMFTAVLLSMIFGFLSIGGSVFMGRSEVQAATSSAAARSSFCM